MTKLRKAGLAAAAAATVGAGVLGGAAIANASDGDASASHRYGYGAHGGPDGDGGPGERPWQAGGPFSEDEVTGDELAKVTTAVQGHDATLTVDHVVKKDDGTYLVLATTDDDARTALTVSADLATVEEAEGGPGFGPGRGGPGHGPMGGAEVTGQELTDLTAAVTAHDASLTVERAFQREDDGDYFVLATKGDEHVGLKVSSDLTTVEELERPDGARGPGGGPGGRGPFGGPSGGAEQQGQQES
jgi:hypothetical protein